MRVGCKAYLTCGYSLDRRSGETERLWRTLSNHIRSIVLKIPQRSHLREDVTAYAGNMTKRPILVALRQNSESSKIGRIGKPPN